MTAGLQAGIWIPHSEGDVDKITQHIHHPAQTTNKDFGIHSNQPDLLHQHPACTAFHFFILHVSALEFVTNCIVPDATCNTAQFTVTAKLVFLAKCSAQVSVIRLSSTFTNGTADHASKTLKLADGYSEGHLVLLRERSKHVSAGFAKILCIFSTASAQPYIR